MTRTDAARIRNELLAVKVWIEHFRADAASNLIPTPSMLILAKAHTENAMALLDRIDAEKDAA